MCDLQKRLFCDDERVWPRAQARAQCFVYFPNVKHFPTTKLAAHSIRLDDAELEELEADLTVHVWREVLRELREASHAETPVRPDEVL